MSGRKSRGLPAPAPLLSSATPWRICFAASSTTGTRGNASRKSALICARSALASRQRSQASTFRPTIQVRRHNAARASGSRAARQFTTCGALVLQQLQPRGLRAIRWRHQLDRHAELAAPGLGVAFAFHFNCLRTRRRLLDGKRELDRRVARRARDPKVRRCERSRCLRAPAARAQGSESCSGVALDGLILRRARSASARSKSTRSSTARTEDLPATTKAVSGADRRCGSASERRAARRRARKAAAPTPRREHVARRDHELGARQARQRRRHRAAALEHRTVSVEHLVVERAVGAELGERREAHAQRLSHSSSLSASICGGAPPASRFKSARALSRAPP